MNTSKLTPGQMIAAAGGLVLIISLFLSWIEGPVGGSANAWDSFSAMDIILLLIGLAAIALAAVAATEGTMRAPSEAGLILTLLGAIAFGWALGWDLENSSAGIGSWLALFSSIAITYGGYETWRVQGLGAAPRVGAGTRGAGVGAASSAGAPPAGSAGGGEVRSSEPPPPRP